MQCCRRITFVDKRKMRMNVLEMIEGEKVSSQAVQFSIDNPFQQVWGCPGFGIESPPKLIVFSTGDLVFHLIILI